MGLCKPMRVLFILVRKVRKYLPEEGIIESGCGGGVVLKELKVWLDWGERG